MFTSNITVHEHLDAFGLINMNGRVYDPVLARFLSPDPIVQAPGYGQSYNRYSYCLNNPLVCVDPSGYTMYHLSSSYDWINDPMILYSAQAAYFSQFQTFSSGGSRVTGFSNRLNKPAPYVYDWTDNCYRTGYGTQVSYDEVYYNYISKYATVIFQNDDVQFVSLQRAPDGSKKYSNNGSNSSFIRALIKRVFGEIRGLRNVYVNGELPPNCNLINGYYVTKDGSKAWGATYCNNIYISPAAQQAGPYQLFATIGHELVHVYHYEQGLDVSSTTGIAQTEHAAWSYTEIFARSLGWSSMANEAFYYHTYINKYNPLTIDTRYESYVLPFHW